MGLSEEAWRVVPWREGSNETLSSRFDTTSFARWKRAAPHPLEWLLIEWPEGEKEPTKYWLSTLPEDTPIDVLADTAKLRWRIEREGAAIPPQAPGDPRNASPILASQTPLRRRSDPSGILNSIATIRRQIRLCSPEPSCAAHAAKQSDQDDASSCVARAAKPPLARPIRASALRSLLLANVFAVGVIDEFVDHAAAPNGSIETCRLGGGNRRAPITIGGPLPPDGVAALAYASGEGQ